MAVRTPRITGGSLRGRALAGTPARTADLRPTTARIREAIFSILAGSVAGASVLDLYAGTGLMGIEALSRGAAHATFIEASRPRCATLSRNLAALNLTGSSSVICGRLPAALARFAGTASLAFLDPPYDDETAGATLQQLHRVLDQGATVVYEHSSRYNPPERPAGLVLFDRRRYGDSAVALYHISESE